LQKHLTTLLKRKTLYKHKLKPFSCPICGKKVKAIDAVNSQFIEGIIVCKDCNGLELDLKALIIKTKKGDDKLLNESIGSLLKAHYVS
jgi:transcription elongation factor Elf1